MKEAHKKIKHWPLRRLFEEIPGLLLDLKPCLFMSPLSVSQYLPADAGRAHFDLVIFDEASQILPEDAIGAIYRGKQTVITGDNRQLPPTTFFQVLEEADDDDEAADEPAVFESILDAALAAGLPSYMLRWHYRSRHESLIAFSNARFYDGKLVTFPGAHAEHPELGIQWHPVADGVYERGGRRVNLPEARAVADLVCAHFQRHPEKTLGVIAFSYPQMTAIQDEIDRRVGEHAELEKHLHGDRLGGFFIKNLETVQGDERDVVILSVGYGRDAAGKLILNFGPLNRDGGARRLNVAITRARAKLIIVSSLGSRDIAAPAANESGLARLREYLEFAERGVDSLPAAADGTPAPMLTCLHEDMMREISRLGFATVPLVGCGSYRLDIAVVDPKEAGRFLLGIELDGPAYASAATARDRERIRPDTLRALDWKLHRVWTPDWLFRRGQEIERLQTTLASGLQAK